MKSWITRVSIVARVLGVALAAVGVGALGLLVSVTGDVGSVMGSPLALVVVALIAAWLLRSWWALLVVPILSLTSAVVAAMWIDAATLPGRITWNGSNIGYLVFFSVVGLGPFIVIGAVVGTLIGKSRAIFVAAFERRDSAR